MPSNQTGTLYSPTIAGHFPITQSPLANRSVTTRVGRLFGSHRDNRWDLNNSKSLKRSCLFESNPDEFAMSFNLAEKSLREKSKVRNSRQGLWQSTAGHPMIIHSRSRWKCHWLEEWLRIRNSISTLVRKSGAFWCSEWTLRRAQTEVKKERMKTNRGRQQVRRVLQERFAEIDLRHENICWNVGRMNVTKIEANINGNHQRWDGRR